MCGLGLTYWAPAAAGSGIPQVKVAFTLRFGIYLRPETHRQVRSVRLPDWLRRFAGRGRADRADLRRREQPAGARWRGSVPKNRRRMASVGMAAGIAAAFNAPIAAVTFTLEELIGDLDQTMLSGVIVAAALAAVVEHSRPGIQPHLSRAAALSNWRMPLR